MSEPSCEFPSVNAPDAQVEALLRSAKTIAVVGLSNKPDRPAYRVAEYLQHQGYKIIPVNPTAEDVLGEKGFGSLLEIKQPVDVVDVFRKPDAVMEIAEQAIQIKAKALWLQLGIVNNAASEKARQAGLTVIQNKCMSVEHHSL